MKAQAEKNVKKVSITCFEIAVGDALFFHNIVGWIFQLELATIFKTLQINERV